jgi:hypothetical protein
VATRAPRPRADAAGGPWKHADAMNTITTGRVDHMPRPCDQTALYPGRQQPGSLCLAWLVVEVDAGGDQDHQDGRGDPVDDEAERWPPAGVGDIVVAVLPEVFEPVAGEADY